MGKVFEFNRSARVAILSSLFLLGACGGGGTSSPPSGGTPPPAPPPPPPSSNEGPASCAAGVAAGFSCNDIDLQKNISLADMGAASGNDIWGWTDPSDGTEYALMGLDNGVSFVRLSDPQNPVLVGKLPTHTVASTWRDIKTFSNHAFIVADAAGSHGMQVFDLTRLRGSNSNQTFTADALYSSFTNAHNIAINEDSGFAYVVGSDTCDEGLHMIDISAPLTPAFMGCHMGGDTHDTQCVNYIGPDADYAGAEICFSSNSDAVGIANVSDKNAPGALASFIYPNLQFVHQAWLDDTHTYLIVNDELDERDLGQQTSTIVLDISDLDNPTYLYTHAGTKGAIDHNLYVVGNTVFEANYAAGLQILEFTDLATDTFVETAFFDTRPEDDNASFNGAWSIYPYFASGNLILSDTDRGLFILKRQ